MKLPERFFVLALLLLAAGLRLWAIDFGAPPPELYPTAAAARTIHPGAALHPDEFFYVSIPLRMRVQGTLMPDFYENPSLLITLNWLTYALTGADQGRTAEAWAAIGAGDRDYASFDLYVIGRAYSALGGLLAVAAVYAATRRLAGRQAAAAAGLLCAVAFPLVQHAHYATTSSLAAGFAAVGLWAGVMAATARGGAVRWFIIAGVGFGLAASSRYNAAPLAVLLLVVGGWLLTRRAPLIGLVAGFAAAAAAFAITSPYVLLDFAAAWEQIRYIVGVYSGGAGLFNTPNGLAVELRYAGLYGLGLPASALAILGLMRALAGARGGKLAAWLGLTLALVAYALLVLRTQRPSHADQLLVPVLPWAIVCAGAGADAAARRLGSPLARAALLAGLIALPLAPTLQFTRRMGETDTRYRMAAWVAEHLPRGAAVHLNGPYNVPLDPAWHPVTQNFARQYPSLEEVIASGARYVVISDAWLMELRRLPQIVGQAAADEVAAYLAAWESALVPLARIERPAWIGEAEPPNAAAVWHHPGLTLYAVPSGAATRP